MNLNKRAVLSHSTGNANVRHAALALAEAGLLGQFDTTVAVFEGSVAWRFAGSPGLGELRRRSYPAALRSVSRCHPWREAARLLASRVGLPHLVAHEQGFACIDAVIRGLDGRVARAVRRGGFDGVYGYEDGALLSFQAAKDRRLRCLYDLPIGYWRAGREIQQEECERRPEWACTMPAMIDSAGKLERKDAELRMADAIVVATSFTKQTLTHAPFPVAPVTVIPYGAPAPSALALPKKRRDPSQPLKVLFVGSLGQRKGVADLLDAMTALGSGATLTLIGQKPAQSCRPLEEALQKHRWIASLPHQGILREMAEHDVLVFPSLFEGFGLVILEAMAQGLPVITTPNTAGPDILSEGVDGFIVPIRSANDIRDRLELLRTDHQRLEAMSAAARAKAGQFAWETYRKRLADWVRRSLA